MADTRHTSHAVFLMAVRGGRDLPPTGTRRGGRTDVPWRAWGPPASEPSRVITQVEIGRRVRELRKGLGLTQEALAGLTTYSRRWIVDLEAGRVDPSLSEIGAISAAVRVKPEDLVTELARGGMAAPREPREELGRLEAGDIVNRRDFLRWMARLGASVAITDAELMALALDPSTPDDLRQLNLAFGRQIRTASPRTLLPVVRGHLKYVSAVLDRAAVTWRRDLLSIAGEAAAFAGNLAYRMDNRGDAKMYYTLAGKLAVEAEDTTLQAVLCTFWRNFFSSVPTGGVGGDTGAAQVWIEEGARLLGESTPPIVRTYVLVSRAEEHAVAGNESECRRSLEAAEQAFARAGKVDGYFHHWNAVRLASWRGNCELLLNNSRKAVEILDDVCAKTPSDVIGWYASAVTDLAAAYAGEGEPERTCQLLHSALDVAGPAGVRATGVDRVAGVRKRCIGAELAGLQDVQALDERLQVLALAPRSPA